MVKKMSHPEILLRLSQVLAKYAPVHRTTWWRWVKSGAAPKPVQICGTTVWRLKDIERWQRRSR